MSLRESIASEPKIMFKNIKRLHDICDYINSSNMIEA